MSLERSRKTQSVSEGAEREGREGLLLLTVVGLRGAGGDCCGRVTMLYVTGRGADDAGGGAGRESKSYCQAGQEGGYRRCYDFVDLLFGHKAIYNLGIYNFTINITIEGGNRQTIYDWTIYNFTINITIEGGNRQTIYDGTIYNFTITPKVHNTTHRE